MSALSKIFEKILTSLVVSILIFVGSFSFMTGRFPPRKDDLIRSFSLLKQMFVSSQDVNAKTKEMNAAGGNVSIEQIVEFQRLSLKRAEVTLELTAIFKRINAAGGADPNVGEALQKIQVDLDAAEKGLIAVAAQISKNPAEAGAP